MVPVDLAHTEASDKALPCVASLARQAGAPACFVGGTGSAPSSLARNPEAFAQNLSAFAQAKGADLGITATHKPGLGDYIWPSIGGKLAAHTAASVFPVRG